VSRGRARGRFSRQPRIAAQGHIPWPEQQALFYAFPGHYRRSARAAQPYRLRKHKRR